MIGSIAEANCLCQNYQTLIQIRMQDCPMRRMANIQTKMAPGSKCGKGPACIAFAGGERGAGAFQFE